MSASGIPEDHYKRLSAQRRELCGRIAVRAGQHGVQVTPEQVNRHFLVWMKWHTGVWALGRVLNQTGLKKGGGREQDIRSRR